MRFVGLSLGVVWGGGVKENFSGVIVVVVDFECPRCAGRMWMQKAFEYNISVSVTGKVYLVHM
jgi:hypothetical protein